MHSSKANSNRHALVRVCMQSAVATLALTSLARAVDISWDGTPATPLNFGDGYDATPAELRMGMKILKDAGVVPAEVEWLREAAALEARIAASADAIYRALTMPLEERVERWQDMIRSVREQNIGWWRRSFLAALDAAVVPA